MVKTTQVLLISSAALATLHTPKVSASPTKLYERLKNRFFGQSLEATSSSVVPNTSLNDMDENQSPEATSSSVVPNTSLNDTDENQSPEATSSSVVPNASLNDTDEKQSPEAIMNTITHNVNNNNYLNVYNVLEKKLDLIPRKFLQKRLHSIEEEIEEKTDNDMSKEALKLLLTSYLHQKDKKEMQALFVNESMNVPKDVSITGFDDIELAKIVIPELTTVHVPHQEMGNKAAVALVDMVENKSSPLLKPLEAIVKFRNSLAAV